MHAGHPFPADLAAVPPTTSIPRGRQPLSLTHAGHPPYLAVHDPLLLEACVEHVHGVHLAPEVPVVLGIVASSQVAKRSRHVCTFTAKEGKG